MDHHNIWDTQHEKYAQSEWINKPSLFALWAIDYFPVKGNILELGCGQGQDTRFFAEHSYSVVALDSSESGIAYAKEKTAEHLNAQIQFEVSDFSQSLHFNDDSFDVVYSHLALHYFDAAVTAHLFAEVRRVLRSDGVVAFLVNSTSDPEYAVGSKIEEDYFEVRDVNKRFFDIQSAKRFTQGFKVVELDNLGETYKDRAIGTENLIRYIGKKL